MDGGRSLRPDDQTKLSAKIKGEAGSLPATVGPAPTGQFVAEYAKSGRSTCRACDAQIEQGQVRLGKMERVDSDHFHGALGRARARDRVAGTLRHCVRPVFLAVAGIAPVWFHKDCFFMKSNAEGWNVSSYMFLQGYKDLRAETLKELAVLTGEDASAAAASKKGAAAAAAPAPAPAPKKSAAKVSRTVRSSCPSGGCARLPRSPVLRYCVAEKSRR